MKKSLVLLAAVVFFSINGSAKEGELDRLSDKYTKLVTECSTQVHLALAIENNPADDALLQFLSTTAAAQSLVQHNQMELLGKLAGRVLEIGISQLRNQACITIMTDLLQSQGYNIEK